ncbi:ArsR family transcriptional regulator [Paenibacillus sp. MY03]|jgi:predicted ArsR family transcriptional regulator|uniref:Transcriptional regulator n=1 Tax=Paenibacillus agaridevorans TaxID=171404 RepID=A0A2R5EU76_9BACL|nr:MULTISPECIES: metalloregulator ArsR/SmtB family transcription factor [Paenibacillus]OUS77218.1 ArsR family transcriptional regulator [Paenibacillus sp. MY03]GBG07343.1 transcriptional regulator [Paenibacillus agaridevorans]
MTNIEQGQLSTREYILQLLKTRGALSTKDLTEELGITVMAVRRHIQSLERDNLIASKTIRQSMGRPTAVYTLTGQAEGFFPRKYHTLTLELLNELEDHFGEKAVDQLFDGRKDKMLKKYDQSMQGKDISDRVSKLAEIQNENGYMVEWEKVNDDEYLLKEHNCPIEQVASKYQHACQCELQLFKSLLGDADVSRTECLAKGGQRCTYSIKKKKEKKQ